MEEVQTNYVEEAQINDTINLTKDILKFIIKSLKHIDIE